MCDCRKPIYKTMQCLLLPEIQIYLKCVLSIFIASLACSTHSITKTNLLLWGGPSWWLYCFQVKRCWRT